MRASRLASILLWLSVVLFVILPLYAVAVTLAIRSNVFNWTDKSLSPDEYKALWTFLASGLTAVVTSIGLLLTRSHNQRTLALQKDIEDQRLRTQVEADKRLALDTAVKSLELVGSPDGTYLAPARIAGALATLVHLEHPVIAMRTLDSAWNEGVVDAATGCWLIGEVFKSPTSSKASMVEASRILNSHSTQLCGEVPGDFSWPAAIYEDWPKRIPFEARVQNLSSILITLTSQDKAWWGTTYNWAVVLLHVILTSDKDHGIRTTAAYALQPLLETYRGRNTSTLYFARRGRGLPFNEVYNTVSNYDYTDAPVVTYVYEQIEDLRSWAGASLDAAT